MNKMEDVLVSRLISSSSIFVNTVALSLIRFKHSLEAQRNQFKMAIYKREKKRKKNRENSKSFIY